MNRFVKIGSCLLAFLLFAYLILVDYPKFKESLVPVDNSIVGEELDAADSSADSSAGETDAAALEEDSSVEEADTEEDETAALEAQAEALEQELTELREQCGPTQVALFLDQSSDVVYDELYAAMTTAQFTGTIVFRDGALTGNYQIIETSEFKTMNEAGWEYAIGGDSTDIDLTGTVTAAAWQTSLETYMKDLRARTGITPTLYVFQEGEYQADYDAVLEELGYTALLYSPEDAAADTADSALTKLVGINVSAETDASALLEELQDYPCAVLVAEVDAADSTEEDAFLVADYVALLQELQADSNVTITTGTEVLESAADSDRQALLDQIQEKEAELAQVQAQLE
ncbi:MAG: polysaccharide deacetylase family protein [Lachnospiraceae bacterium]|nr:polysaccharide deacetylase family protein [Lachnospiraceae bacterium]